MRISELRNKDLITEEDGRKLGFIQDVEINVQIGRVEALVIPEESRHLFFWRRGEERLLPWEQIRKIGMDVILLAPAVLKADAVGKEAAGAEDPLKEKYDRMNAPFPAWQQTKTPAGEGDAPLPESVGDIDFFTFGD